METTHPRFTRLSLILCAIAAALTTAGCSEDETTRPPGPKPYAVALTHPDSLLVDLEASHENREIAPYANLLSSDFEFHFHPEDLTPAIPLGFWNRTEDSTGTRGFLTAPDVLEIDVEMVKTAQEEVEVDGQSLTRVTVLATISVPTVGDITFFMLEQEQRFYFRVGLAEAGEDPGRLYLVRWDEMGWRTKPGKPDPAAVPATAPVTWGRFKTLWR